MANSKKEFKLDVAKVGAKLKALRKSHDFVQDDIANFLNVTRSSYASIERGTYGTRVEVLAKIIIFYAKQGIDLYMEDLIGLNEFLERKDRISNAKVFVSYTKENESLRTLIEALQGQIETLQKYNNELQESKSQVQKDLAEALGKR